MRIYTYTGVHAQRTHTYAPPYGGVGVPPRVSITIRYTPLLKKIPILRSHLWVLNLTHLKNSNTTLITLF